QAQGMGLSNNTKGSMTADISAHPLATRRSRVPTRRSAVMASIDRRRFLKAAGVAGAGTVASTIAVPAIAQSSPEIRWRMPTSWPKSLDTLQGGADHFVKLVAEATDGKFQIRAIAGGDAQIPALEGTD